MMNKKIIILLISVVLLTSCSKEIENAHQKEVIQEKVENDYVDPYIDNNPITLGLYQNKSGTKTLINSLDSPLIIYQDIASFEVYYTNELTITGNQKTLWNNYYNQYQNINNYKIGYYISFDTQSGKIEKTILNPSDVESFFDYIQIYLYDDINQNSSWYSHITTNEISEKTILTSIKLTASTKIKEVTSDIDLKVFTYDYDDFDSNNNYRGKSSYNLTIKQQK